MSSMACVISPSVMSDTAALFDEKESNKLRRGCTEKKSKREAYTVSQGSRCKKYIRPTTMCVVNTTEPILNRAFFICLTDLLPACESE